MSRSSVKASLPAPRRAARSRLVIFWWRLAADRSGIEHEHDAVEAGGEHAAGVVAEHALQRALRAGLQLAPILAVVVQRSAARADRVDVIRAVAPYVVERIGLALRLRDEARAIPVQDRALGADDPNVVRAAA